MAGLKAVVSFGTAKNDADGYMVVADSKTLAAANAPSATTTAMLEDIIHCVVTGQSARLEQLLSQGIYADSVNAEGDTLLYLAAEHGHFDTVRSLVKFGADVNFESPTDYRNTPLHTACYNGHTEVALYLLDNGANVDAANDEGRTSLHQAASRGRRVCCRCLISRGADIRAEDNEGLTAIDLMNVSEMPTQIEVNTTELYVSDRQLRVLWNEYDVNGDGFIDENEMQRLLNAKDQMGIPAESASKAIREMIDKVRPADGRIRFPEFARLMLMLAQH
eukprot:NODE_1123_length_1000_cov_105.093929_g1078_i0.p1 GENE.NODE_1123_length_1000_cov_105.093929_g1078_i0~~NODE_1123_length_1000_cov_105.093929_g1078_i0.p1  ORF type:complete len:277 (-),score=32.86 NODE_1123_length_1000_cov_105.093929_g1078_i0:66-896(-)